MTQTTPSASASSAPTKIFEKVFAQPGTATETTSTVSCQVHIFEDYTASAPQTPAKHTEISDLIAQWEKDDRKRAALEDARRWIADAFYEEDGDTVRTLRLRKGWSQTRLAEELATSQPHVARIERGTENLAITTCRKLCDALEIDMNTLDLVLKRQEAIEQAMRK